MARATVGADRGNAGLQWQLLTKRPDLALELAPWRDRWPDNVWLGTSVENARFTFRAHLLREIPAAVRFISAEPILGSLFVNGKPNRTPLDLAGIDWLIAGGESGPRCRPVTRGGSASCTRRATIRGRRSS